MKAFEIALICYAVFVIVLIVVVLALLALIFYYLSKLNTTPFHDGDIIRMSFLTDYQASLASYYNISAEVNDNNQCPITYKTLNLSVEISDNLNLTLNTNSKDANNPFTLRAKDGSYCYLATDAKISTARFIAFGAKDPIDQFIFQQATNGNYNLVTSDGKVGLIALPSSYNNCYRGNIINQAGKNTAYILGVNNTNPLEFNITNLTNPLRPSSVNFQ